MIFIKERSWNEETQRVSDWVAPYLGVAWAACNQTIVMTEAHVIQKWPGNASRQSNKVRQRQRETKDEVKEATLSGMAIKDLITPVGSDCRLLQRRLFVVLGLFDQSRR
jgi:hypothetical protein